MSTNWIHESQNATEADVAAAKKANKIEAKKIKNGWRWVKIIPSLSILVPYKDGKPTPEGQAMIDHMKEKFYVK